MAINNPYAGPAVVQPRLRVLSMPDGTLIPGALSADVTSTNNFHADRFNLKFVPGFTPSAVGSMAWWGSQATLLVDIQAGLVSPSGAVSWTSWQQGQVDSIDCDRTGWTVAVEGRDLTARFIDNKIEAAYPNQTSSQIVAALAAKEGINAKITPTRTIVGRYYEAEHDYITQDQFSRPRPEWDLITMLARFEGFDAFVQGQTLYFQPATALSSDPYVVWHTVDQSGRQSSNLLTLQASRSLTVAKGINVTVKSWHANQARGFTRSAPNSRTTQVSRTQSEQQYVIVRPNLTEDQAQQLANQIFMQISQHERTIAGSLPADMLLTPRCVMRLDGTGTAFDTLYYPDEVTRHLSPEEGWVMRFRAKTTPPIGDTTG